MTSDGRKVSAYEADAFRGMYCPACGGLVTLVRAFDRDVHFRHLPYSASAGCPLYNPHDGYWNGAYIGSRYDRPTPPWKKVEGGGQSSSSKDQPSTSQYTDSSLSKSRASLALPSFHVSSLIKPVLSGLCYLWDEFTYTTLFSWLYSAVRAIAITCATFLAVTFCIVGVFVSESLEQSSQVGSSLCLISSFAPILVLFYWRRTSR